MRSARLSTLLRLGGLFVGVATILALVLGVEPARIAPFLVKVALYKLAFIAALGLLVAGGVVGRRENSRGVTPTK
ncbi:MAG: hypothetical protein M3Y30_16355 [Gemmatimonadota bacterium]|nr:hypothetical protein [Gemmatimonadota bacterium]